MVLKTQTKAKFVYLFVFFCCWLVERWIGWEFPHVCFRESRNAFQATEKEKGQRQIRTAWRKLWPINRKRNNDVENDENDENDEDDEDDSGGGDENDENDGKREIGQDARRQTGKLHFYSSVSHLFIGW